MLIKDSPEEFGFERKTHPVTKKERQPQAGKFVTRTFRLVPLTELEDDAYGPGGPCSGKPKPKFREELVAERYFEGIG